MVPIRAGHVWAGSTLWVSTFRLPTATQARCPPKPCSCCPEVSGRHIFISSWLCFWVLQKGFHGVGWTVDPGGWGGEWPPLQMGEGGIVWGQGRSLCPDVGIGSLGSPLKACPWDSQSFLRECYFISLQTMRPEDKFQACSLPLPAPEISGLFYPINVSPDIFLSFIHCGFLPFFSFFLLITSCWELVLRKSFRHRKLWANISNVCKDNINTWKSKRDILWSTLWTF